MTSQGQRSGTPAMGAGAGPCMSTVALSFDNGPDPEVTPKVLDVLARRGVKASFFVLGNNLASRRQLKLSEGAIATGLSPRPLPGGIESRTRPPQNGCRWRGGK